MITEHFFLIDHQTQPVDGATAGLAGLWAIAPLFWLAPLLAAAALETALSRRQPPSPAMVIGASAVVVAFIVLVPIAGHLAGSQFVIDNASGDPQTVAVDGRPLGTLPPMSHLWTRIGGDDRELTFTRGQEQIEQVRLHLDRGWGARLWRGFVGSGGPFIYNLCHANGYRVGTADYQR